MCWTHGEEEERESEKNLEEHSRRKLQKEHRAGNETEATVSTAALCGCCVLLGVTGMVDGRSTHPLLILYCGL
jgi:hypothetical protein